MLASVSNRSISIHAAREGGDGTRRPRRNAADGFQSTPPVKAATQQNGRNNSVCQISIHAAREGGDEPPVTSKQLPNAFQSTPPVKAATAARMPKVRNDDISIHAAREGGDSNAADFVCKQRRDFNPRRP